MARGRGRGNSGRGGGQNDQLTGTSGIDEILGDKGHDQIDGGANDDLLEGGRGHDTLLGGLGNDSLDGGREHDLLSGGAGNDALKGAEGQDTYVGGAGADDFLIGPRNGHDVITDFTAGTDRLVISTPGLSFALLGQTAGSGGLVLDLGNGNRITLQGVTSLSSSDVAFVGTVVAGDVGDDSVSGTAEGDAITGADGNDADRRSR